MQTHGPGYLTVHLQVGTLAFQALSLSFHNWEDRGQKAGGKRGFHFWHPTWTFRTCPAAAQGDLTTVTTTMEGLYVQVPC